MSAISPPTTTLTTIQQKVRRITRAPSQSQLTDQQLNDYINNFVLYDFPEHLRLFALKTTFSFYTAPNIAEYSTVAAPSTSPFYNFNNLYVSVTQPIYIGGYNSFYTQSREQFFNIYPRVSFIQTITTGNGSTSVFTGTIPQVPFLQNEVLIDSIDSNNNPLTYIDQPVDSVNGNLVNASTLVPRGTINYLTGGFLIDFEAPPGPQQPINSQTVPYQAARPLALLYYDYVFTVGPVPDQSYKITMDAYMRPTALLDTTQSPQLEQWWQYIAWGAARKVFEDRMDWESINLMMPEYRKQETLVLRSSLVQWANERVATIYTEQTVSNFNNGFGWGGGLF